MTGYGEAEVKKGEYAVNCEVRSVNNRFLNISVKLPDSFQCLESEIRDAIRSKLKRGSVSITMKAEEVTPGNYEVNTDRIEYYASILKKLKKKTGITAQPDPGIFFLLPGVVESLESRADVKIREATLLAVNRALNSVVKMRIEEGKNLTIDLRQHLDKIKKSVGEIEKRSGKSLEKRRVAFKKRIDEFLTDYDKQRLNLEILVQIDKFDINEEIVRLKGHLNHFKKVLGESSPVGSKLTYLTQEMHREANTLSVKSMDGAISLSAVSIKEELERIREQLQNVE